MMASLKGGASGGSRLHGCIVCPGPFLYSPFLHLLILEMCTVPLHTFPATTDEPSETRSRNNFSFKLFLLSVWLHLPKNLINTVLKGKEPFQSHSVNPDHPNSKTIQEHSKGYIDQHP